MCQNIFCDYKIFFRFYEKSILQLFLIMSMKLQQVARLKFDLDDFFKVLKQIDAFNFSDFLY